MPLYDFSCEACGARFEAQLAYGESPACPECGEPGCERLLSPFAGPFGVRPRGAEARRADATRRAREEQRRAAREQRRQNRDQ
jgi:putative FmdB family regulatory protein